jgi:hypothetical protein
MPYSASLDWRRGMSVQERVARGARWLDGVRPGWRDALELSKLDIHSDVNCVLGQVFAEEATAHAFPYSSGVSYAAMEVIPTAVSDVVEGDWFLAHGFADWPWVGSGHEEPLAAVHELRAPAKRVELVDEWRRIIHVPREECASSVRC